MLSLFYKVVTEVQKDRGFRELRRPWGFSPEARRGSQGASRAAPGKSGLHARGIFLPAILVPACASSSPAFLMMYSA